MADKSVALGPVRGYVNDIWALLPEFVERRAGPMSRQAERCSFNKSPLMIKLVTGTVNLELDGHVDYSLTLSCSVNAMTSWENRSLWWRSVEKGKQISRLINKIWSIRYLVHFIIHMLLWRSPTNTTVDKPPDGLWPELANKADFMKNCIVLTEKALLIITIEYKNNRERSDSS